MTETRIKQIENIILYTTVAVTPFFLTTTFPNPFVTPRLVFLSAGIMLVFLLKAIRGLVGAGRGLTFHTSVFDVPVALLCLSYIVSSFIVSPNRMEAFWLPGETSFIIAGALIYLAINQLVDEGKNYIKYSLLVAAAVVSFFTILSGSGVLKSFSVLPTYMRFDAFSVIGSTLGGSMFLLCLLPLIIELVIKSRSTMIKAMSGVILALTAMALVISAVTLARNWSSNSLPGFTYSWIVTTESLKEQPLFGSGPGNYLSAFTRFIPVSYNATSKWSLRFSNAQDFYMTLITETGLIGFASLVVLLFAVYKKVKSSLKETNLLQFLPLLILLGSFVVFPAQPVLIILLFVFLALSTRGHVVQLFANQNLESGRIEGKIANILVGVPVIAVTLFSGYLIIQATRGEIIYQKSLNLIGAQDGKGAYDTIRDAINISPYSDRYHLTYSQLNLALANALAKKSDLTDSDKSTISQLVQQAIREARSAVILNQQRASIWENLASIYRSVIPLAKGADQFAIQTYSQAVALDPTNPNTRIALGGVYYSLKRYEEAIDVFKLAVVAKPDLANSHYNLAIAYRDNGQYDKALAELQGALTLVDQKSKDYDVLKKEIENVSSKAPKKTTAGSGDNVKAPETASSSASLNGKVELPNDATPPTPVATASPEPTATPGQ